MGTVNVSQLKNVRQDVMDQLHIIIISIQLIIKILIQRDKIVLNQVMYEENLFKKLTNIAFYT